MTAARIRVRYTTLRRWTAPRLSGAEEVQYARMVRALGAGAVAKSLAPIAGMHLLVSAAMLVVGAGLAEWCDTFRQQSGLLGSGLRGLGIAAGITSFVGGFQLVQGLLITFYNQVQVRVWLNRLRRQHPH